PPSQPLRSALLHAPDQDDRHHRGSGPVAEPGPQRRRGRGPDRAARDEPEVVQVEVLERPGDGRRLKGDPRLMSRVGARPEREGTVPRTTAVPRLAKPARHARYAREVDPFPCHCTTVQARLYARRDSKREELALTGGFSRWGSRRADLPSPQTPRGVVRISFVAPALPAATRRSRGHRTVQSHVRSRPEMYPGPATRAAPHG